MGLRGIQRDCRRGSRQRLWVGRDHAKRRCGPFAEQLGDKRRFADLPRSRENLHEARRFSQARFELGSDRALKNHILLTE